MNIPTWGYYLIVVAAFWLGFAVAAVLSISKRFAQDAETMGATRGNGQRGHAPAHIQDSSAPAEAVLATTLLREKKARTRTAKAASNGTQKIHAKHA